jgi:hypothetical protein
MKFKIMGRKGDAVYDYDTATGEVKFNELLSDGLVPFGSSGEGKKLAKVDKFHPDLEEVVWMPKLVGG